MKLIKLTNAEFGEELKTIALNPAFIESVHVSFVDDGENCRVRCAGVEWIVRECAADVLAKIESV